MKCCDLTPPFPKQAFLVSIFLSTKGKLDLLKFPLIKTSLEEVKKVIAMNAAEYDKTYAENGITIPDTCPIIPISFSTRLLLRKEYWDNPSLEYSRLDRQMAFYPALTNPELYQLLVTPRTYDEKTNLWLYTGTIPFPLNTPEETMVQFMKTSDQPVEIRAKYAALYDFGKPIRFNWKTKKTLPLLNPKPKPTTNQSN